MAPKPGPALEAVSSRLKATLLHPSQDGWLWELHYSPDGRRIIAGDYPGGVIRVWDALTAKPLVTIETGYGYRGSADYFFLSPDCSTGYVCREKRKVTPLEKDGKRLYRWQFDGDVRAWDTSTGRLRETFKHDPPRGIDDMILSPDGSTFVTFEELSGEGGPKRAVSLWDVKSKKWRPLPEKLQLERPGIRYSPDGKRLAVTTYETADGSDRAIRLLDAATFHERFSIRSDDKGQSVNCDAFSPDGSLLVGHVGSDKTGDDRLTFWNSTTGREVASFRGTKNGFFRGLSFSPDGRTLAAVNFRGFRDGVSKLFLFDVAGEKLARQRWTWVRRLVHARPLARIASGLPCRHSSGPTGRLGKTAIRGTSPSREFS